MSGNGGLWNAPQVTYSQQTHDLLKEMMRESKLTNFQQRKIQQTLKDGKNLPDYVAPTSSKSDHRKIKKLAPLPKVLNPKVYSGGLRSKNTMEAMGAFEKPEYVASLKGITRSTREKERLANIMAFGEDKPKGKTKRLTEPIEPLPPPPDRFDELQNEIQERQEFLREMEALGKGDQYRTIIATEISQKIREMVLIDKKQTERLQKAIENDKRKSQLT
ncbi:UPF0193 protein EVG1 homolog [Physella acuta]|uniref:UPF0193 protein EVG1 homolog n=1 Tax=Physella acuta TaxID=109671 RepID=UPI0027DAE00F|nr:UPF0193 protein EVG1 homolog [Physella acuta]